MSLSPDSSGPSSEKESNVGEELDSGDGHLGNKRMLPPLLTVPGGAPRMILDSYGVLAFRLPPDHAICQEVRFKMPPAISMENAESAAAEPEHENDNNTDTTFTDGTKVIGAGLVLESKLGDQARAGERDTIYLRTLQPGNVCQYGPGFVPHTTLFMG
jgi:hypothetical protein